MFRVQMSAWRIPRDSFRKLNPSSPKCGNLVTATKGTFLRGVEGVKTKKVLPNLPSSAQSPQSSLVRAWCNGLFQAFY